MKKARRKKAENRIRLTTRDQVLYFFSYLLLVLGWGIYPLVLLLQRKVTLARQNILALSENFSLLWLIPALLIATVGVWVLRSFESKGKTYGQFLAYIVGSQCKRFLLILFVVLYVFFVLLAVFSSQTVMKSDGSIQTRWFGRPHKSYPPESVEEATFRVFYNSTSVPGGRYSSAIGYSCYVFLKTKDGKISTFQHFKLESIFTIAECYPDRIRFEGQENVVERWLQELDCEEEIKIQIRNLFQTE